MFAVHSPFGASPDEQPWYGGPPAAEKGRLFLRKRRQRMNFWPMILCLVGPVLVFAVVAWACSFTLRYESPLLALGVVLLALLFTLVVGFNALVSRFQRGQDAGAERQPSWICFMFLSLCLALVLGVAVGSYNYSENLRPYYDSQNLNAYSDVYPDRLRGQQVMDAGSIMFHEGSRLDVKKSMGFRNIGMYCVVPIVLGEEKMATYDFWAVGRDCCSGTQADFHCEGFNNPHALGGLRLMADGDRPFYRMAVQQAEATYKIRAAHPLFFTWVENATEAVAGWKDLGSQIYKYSFFTYLLLQAFLVAVAAIAFSKLA